jgi:SAM-dependent methyltransferase
MRRFAKTIIRKVMPLSVRKRLAVVIGRQSWLGGRYWYSMELVRDLAEKDPAGFHRFLWENHIGYAESYEVSERFGEENVHPSRRLLFADIRDLLQARGIDRRTAVRSVFEVGCSMGYLLRHMETVDFPGAETLEGVDIDEYAIAEGSRYLAGVGSKIRLEQADMARIGRVLGNRTFDLVLCAGVLMYLPYPEAQSVVDVLLERSRILVLTGPAHPSEDNAGLPESPRRGDGSFIHNLDSMAESLGSKVLFRRWEGPRDVGGNTIYFVIAEGRQMTLEALPSASERSSHPPSRSV